MTMKKLFKEEGFTLIELLLVVALLSIAVGVTGDILVSLIRTYNKNKVMNEIEQNANFISQKLNKELRNATEIVRLDGSGPPAVTEAYNEIEFTDSSGTNNVIYKVNGGVITRDGGDNSDDPLSDSTPPFGIEVTCLTPVNDVCPGPADDDTRCFRLIEDSPQVIKIALCIRQVGDDVSNVFKGDIKIVDTIVVRDTY
jgi:prepilin-type N-terminal cleavage/methylation domain-containing protein